MTLDDVTMQHVRSGSRAEQGRSFIALLLLLKFFGLVFQGQHAEVQVPKFAPGDHEGAQDEHHVERQRPESRPLILKHFGHGEDRRRARGEGHGQPVPDVQGRVEQKADEESRGGEHDDVEHGVVDRVLEHLLPHGLEDVAAGYDDRDDPEQGGEERVERHEENEEASDGRHPPVALRATHDVVRHHDRDRDGVIEVRLVLLVMLDMRMSHVTEMKCDTLNDELMTQSNFYRVTVRHGYSNSNCSTNSNLY